MACFTSDDESTGYSSPDTDELHAHAQAILHPTAHASPFSSTLTRSANPTPAYNGDGLTRPQEHESDTKREPLRPLPRVLSSLHDTPQSIGGSGKRGQEREMEEVAKMERDLRETLAM